MMMVVMREASPMKCINRVVSHESRRHYQLTFLLLADSV